MHIVLHVPTDTKPQHVKTMNVVACYPARQPFHRYCAPRETSMGTVWVSKQNYTLPFVLPFVLSSFFPGGSVSRKHQEQNVAALVLHTDCVKMPTWAPSCTLNTNCGVTMAMNRMLRNGAHLLSTHSTSEDSISVSMITQLLFVW